MKPLPEHVGRTEDYIKLPAVEACSFLRHFCCFQQP